MGKVVSIERSVNIQLTADSPRPVDESPLDLNGADEHGSRKILPFGDDVQAMVHSIDQIDIGHTRRPEQNVGPLRSTF